MTEALLFDLGGVIMDIDRMRAVRAFEELGMPDADAFFDPYRQRGILGDLEAGQISEKEFLDAVRPMFTRPVTDGEIVNGLCRFLIGIPAERLERLKALRAAGYRVGLLSNTNPIMWNAFILPEFMKLGGDISDYFDDVVTSFEAGCCKPDPVIFNLALERMAITPGETTFYDDGRGNLQEAARLGLHTELVDNADPARSFMTLNRL